MIYELQIKKEKWEHVFIESREVMIEHITSTWFLDTSMEECRGQGKSDKIRK
jgi:hypothetical protein